MGKIILVVGGFVLGMFLCAILGISVGSFLLIGIIGALFGLVFWLVGQMF